MEISRSRFLPLYLLLCLIWGSTWFVIRIGVDAGLPPFLGAAVRFAIALVFLWGWVIVKRIPLPSTKSEWRAVIFNGFFASGCSFSIVYWCSQYVPSGLEAVLFGTMPLWTIMISHWVFGSDKLSKHKLGGVLLGIAGISVIFLPDVGAISGSTLGWMALTLLAPFVSAMSLVVTKNYAMKVHPTALNAISISVGFLVLAVGSLLTSDISQLQARWEHWGTILYLAVFGTVITFSGYYHLLQRASAVTMSMITLITPVVAVLSGWMILNEQLHAHTLAGAALVLGGVWLAITDREA
jgi:drug/metabolite transporter (DMT)-like permease